VRGDEGLGNVISVLLLEVGNNANLHLILSMSYLQEYLSRDPSSTIPPRAKSVFVVLDFLMSSSNGTRKHHRSLSMFQCSLF